MTDPNSRRALATSGEVPGPRTSSSLNTEGLTGVLGPRVAAVSRGSADAAVMPTTSPAPIDLLLSFAFHQNLDHRSLHDRLPAGSLVWIDSGAFTAYTTGKVITVEEYADHLEANRGGYDYAFTLDVIGDHRQSMLQTERLISMGHEVVPIYTYGTPIAEFHALCRDYGYVGAGGVVPLVKNRPALTRYLRHLTRIAEEYGTAVHALGTAGRSTVIATKVWSADSSTVSSAPLYGQVPIYDRRRRRLQMLQAADTKGLYKYRDALLHYGFPLEQVMRSGRWTKDERPAMFRASLLSVADMWADVRLEHPVPAPTRLPAPATYKDTPHPTPAGPRPAYAYADFGTPIDPILEGPFPGPLGDRPGVTPRAASAPGSGDGRTARALDGPRTSSSIAGGPYAPEYIAGQSHKGISPEGTEI